MFIFLGILLGNKIEESKVGIIKSKEREDLLGVIGQEFKEFEVFRVSFLGDNFNKTRLGFYRFKLVLCYLLLILSSLRANSYILI